MFVGMEHITLSNRTLADEALNAAYRMCKADPLLVNERAVMAFNHGKWVLHQLPRRQPTNVWTSYERAAQMFEESTQLAQITQSSQKTWATVYMNLGTCYRKLGSVSVFPFVLRAESDSSIGFCKSQRQRMARYWKLIHEARLRLGLWG